MPRRKSSEIELPLIAIEAVGPIDPAKGGAASVLWTEAGLALGEGEQAPETATAVREPRRRGRPPKPRPEVIPPPDGRESAPDGLVLPTPHVAAPSDTALSGSLALIDRLARDPSVDVDKLERILAMQERLIAKEAEGQFNASKARIKDKLKDIRFTRTKDGPDKAYRYMPLDEMDRLLAPLLAAESMDLSFTDDLLPNGWIVVRGRLKHLPGGHFEDSSMPGPPDRVNKMKSELQAIGSTNSFMRRYVTANIFNIVVVGDDDDGTAGFIDDSQISHIRELIAQVQAKSPRSDETAFCRLMKIPALSELPFRRYHAATSQLFQRLAELAPKGSADTDTGSGGSGGGP